MKNIIMVLAVLCLAGAAVAQGRADGERGQRQERQGQAAEAQQRAINIVGEQAAELEKEQGKAGARGEAIAQDARQKQEQAREKAGAAAEEAKKKAEKGRAKGEETQAKERMTGQERAAAAKLAASQRQLIHEQQKSLERQARLERMLELAQENGNQEAVERVQRLMERETQRHMKHAERLRGGE